MYQLNPESGVPLYMQLSSSIREKINTGLWKSGSKIPSEQKLSELYGVSRITLRKAVEDLVEDELLIKKQGKGTFVAPVRIKKQLQNFLSFTEACKNVGMTPSAKLISIEIKQTSRSNAKFFDLSEEEPMVIIKRIRFADERPVILETNILPEKFKFLLMENLEGSLYELLNVKNIIPEKSVKTVEVCVANNIEEKYLKVPCGTPLLLLNDLVYDNKMEPLHICKQIIRTDLFKLIV